MNLLLKSATLGLLPAFLALLLIAPDSLAQGTFGFRQSTVDYFVVGSDDSEGDNASDFPFRIPDGRLQQFYPASIFSSLSSAIVIVSVAFRVNGDDSVGFLQQSFNTVTLMLSTKPSTGTPPSPNFSENRGPDATTVFDGPITFNAAKSSGPAPFDIKISFTTPYSYDPKLGDLILELSHDRQFGLGGRLDAVSSGTPELLGTRNNDMSATLVGGVIVTQFGYTSVPEFYPLNLFIACALVFFVKAVVYKVR